MRHGSLFSGIGGFDLAAEWMGWDNIFHCEINKFCQKILKYYWPNATIYGDIKTTDFSIWRGRIDIITGGFPCQPYSTAGKRKGKADNRHLWPEMLRAIREIQPTWIVGENVPGLLNWQRGMVLAEIKADLETEGFEVFPPCILPACGKNAPHRRDRVWIIAHNNNNGCNRSNGKYEINASKTRLDALSNIVENVNNGIVTDTKQQGRKGRDDLEKSILLKQGAWDSWPTAEPTICCGNDGLSESLVGVTFSKHRNESIKGFGNGIVPQLAHEIFKTIDEFENL